jgi:hypothetical protein
MGGNQKSLIQEESGKSDAIIIAEVAVVLVFVIACLILFVAGCSGSCFCNRLSHSICCSKFHLPGFSKFIWCVRGLSMG